MLVEYYHTQILAHFGSIKDATCLVVGMSSVYVHLSRYIECYEERESLFTMRTRRPEPSSLLVEDISAAVEYLCKMSLSAWDNVPLQSDSY